MMKFRHAKASGKYVKGNQTSYNNTPTKRKDTCI